MTQTDKLLEALANVARKTGTREAAGLRDTSYKRGIEWATDRIVEAIRATTVATAATDARAIDLLTNAVGDIAAALMLAGKEGKIRAWTAPYVEAINAHDAKASEIIAALPQAGEVEEDAYGRTGEREDCMSCGGKGTEYGETCLTCGGYGWVNNPTTPTETPTAAAPDDGLMGRNPKPAFDALKEMMEADPEYAWGWHCNLAMPIMDSIGCSHADANKAAAYLMQFLWGVDTSKQSRAALSTATGDEAQQGEG